MGASTSKETTQKVCPKCPEKVCPKFPQLTKPVIKQNGLGFAGPPIQQPAPIPKELENYYKIINLKRDRNYYDTKLDFVELWEKGENITGDHEIYSQYKNIQNGPEGTCAYIKRQNGYERVCSKDLCQMPNIPIYTQRSLKCIKFD